MEDSDVDAFLCQTKLQWNSDCVGIVTKIVSFQTLNEAGTEDCNTAARTKRFRCIIYQ